MKRSNAIALFVVCCAHTAFVAHSNSPSIVIDGHLEEEVWRNLSPEMLTPSEVGVPRETGGEIRAIVIGRFLYIGARLPEPTGRITARPIGGDPGWGDEGRLRNLFWADIGYNDLIFEIDSWCAY